MVDRGFEPCGQGKRVLTSPPAGVQAVTTSDGLCTRASTTRLTSAVNNAMAEGSSMGKRCPSMKRAMSSSVAGRARPSTRASPDDSSSPSGALCIENRGSRRRSSVLRETASIASHRWPSRIGASIPDSRGAPSRRRVAITAWRWLSNRSWTAAARSGSASRKSDHVTATLTQTSYSRTRLLWATSLLTPGCRW